jgi:hypothetical protein
LGFDPNVENVNSNKILIGYFQTFLHITRINHEKFVSFPSLVDKKVSDYKALAVFERPLIIHVRLGDYRYENEIGILSFSYYESCLNESWNSNSFGKIWLFSDEPQNALEKLPSNMHRHIRIIDSVGLSSAETLQVMTYGSGYIIGNSTFSWWGAYLRENQAAIVYCPQPWFKNMDEPKKIVPDQWKRMNGFDSVE